MKALINGGPTGFDCAWAGLGQAGVGGRGAVPIGGASSPEPGNNSIVDSSSKLAPTATGVTMRCTIPADVRVAAGMTGMMVLQMGKPTTTQALPVTAVIGSAGQGQVVVVKTDKSTEVRTVQLGVSDIYNIQITGGLDPSETVLQNPTQSDFARSGQGS